MQRAYAFYAFKQHNGYELDRIFGLKEGLPWYLQFVRVVFRLGISRRFYSKRTADFVLSLFRIKVIDEAYNYEFDPSLLKPWFGIRILYGGWHDSRYFHPSEAAVRTAFSFPPLDDVNDAILQQIDAVYGVSIHVRRGDYLKGINSNLFGGIATLEYYRNAIGWAITYCKHRSLEIKFYVFSDDIDWCKQNLGLRDAVYVSGNSKTDSWKDILLMSHCRANIIANSTFSWWAAWLNQQPNKVVICPTKFINTDSPNQTIYPAAWHQIEG